MTDFGTLYPSRRCFSTAISAAASMVRPGLGTTTAVMASALVEHHVADLAGAVLLYEQVLDGEVVARDAAAADLTRPGGGTIRLKQSAAVSLGALGDLHFSRAAGPLPQADLARLHDLSQRLGICIRVR